MKSRIFALACVLVMSLGGMLIASSTVYANAANIHSLVNAKRKANGLSNLKRNSAMDKVAQDWAKYLADDSRDLAHNPNYSKQVPGGWTCVAENVAAYSNRSNVSSAIVNGWMGSPGHKKNILGDFTDTGVGFASDGKKTYAVQVFANYSGKACKKATVKPSPKPTTTKPKPKPTTTKPKPRPTITKKPAPKPTTIEPTTTPQMTPEPTATPSAAPELPSSQSPPTEPSHSPTHLPSPAPATPTLPEDIENTTASGDSTGPVAVIIGGAIAVAAGLGLFLRRRNAQ